MVEPGQSESPGANPAVKHERSDVHVTGIVCFALVMIVLGVVIHVALWWLFQADMAHEAKIKESSFPLAGGEQRHLPLEPRLEQIDRVERTKLSGGEERRPDKEEILNNYGPTGEDGYVHIPIQRAMTLLADKLPARPVPSKSKEKP